MGEKIRKLRKEKGLRQQDIADFLHVSASTVGMWEHGRRDPDTDILSKIADYFDVTVDYLLGRENTISTQQALIKETIQQIETLNQLKERLKDMLPPE